MGVFVSGMFGIGWIVSGGGGCGGRRGIGRGGRRIFFRVRELDCGVLGLVLLCFVWDSGGLMNVV